MSVKITVPWGSELLEIEGKLGDCHIESSTPFDFRPDTLSGVSPRVQTAQINLTHVRVTRVCNHPVPAWGRRIRGWLKAFPLSTT